MPTNPPDQPKLFTLYGLTRPDHYFIKYVGITCLPLSYRLSKHVYCDGTNLYKDNWINKMRPLRPDIIPLAVELSFEEACELERAVIAGLRLRGHKTCNISNGGEATTLGLKMSPEACRKNGLAKKGIKQSEECIEKKRLASLGNKSRTGQKNSPESNEKRRQAESGEANHFFGKTHSPEAREKMSLANKGRTPWNKGKKLSSEGKYE